MLEKLRADIAREGAKTGILYLWSKIWPYLVSLLFGGAAVVPGYIGDMPMMYLIVAAVVVSSFVYFVILAHQLSSYVLNPSGNLQVSGPVRGIVKNGEIKHGIKYVLILRNTCFGPLDYRITPLHCSLGDSVNAKEGRDPLKGRIEKNAIYAAMAAIPITPKMKNRVVEGALEVEIDYGASGKPLKYKQIKKYRIIIKFDAKGDIKTFEANNYYDDV